MKVFTILVSLFLGASVTLAAPAHRNNNHEYDMCVSGCSDKKGGETSLEKCVEDTCGGRNRPNGQWDEDDNDYDNDCDNEDSEDSYKAKKKPKDYKKQ